MSKVHSIILLYSVVSSKRYPLDYLPFVSFILIYKINNNYNYYIIDLFKIKSLRAFCRRGKLPISLYKWICHWFCFSLFNEIFKYLFLPLRYCDMYIVIVIFIVIMTTVHKLWTLNYYIYISIVYNSIII